MINQETTLVRLDHPLFRASLYLCRTPKYLRFVLDRREMSWDALDQPDDQPEPHEMVFAAVLSQRGTCHIDRTVNGRRVGEWLRTAEYRPLRGQPDSSVLGDTNKWKDWCYAQDHNTC